MTGRAIRHCDPSPKKSTNWKTTDVRTYVFWTISLVQVFHWSQNNSAFFDGSSAAAARLSHWQKLLQNVSNRIEKWIAQHRFIRSFFARKTRANSWKKLFFWILFCCISYRLRGLPRQIETDIPGCFWSLADDPYRKWLGEYSHAISREEYHFVPYSSIFYLQSSRQLAWEMLSIESKRIQFFCRQSRIRQLKKRRRT